MPLIDQAAVALGRPHVGNPSLRPATSSSSARLAATWTTGIYGFGATGALHRAGLGHKRHEDPPLRFHDLRHTFGTLAVQVWPLVDVQAYLGHANISTTMIYAHHVPKRGAADALSGPIENACGESEV